MRYTPFVPSEVEAPIPPPSAKFETSLDLGRHEREPSALLRSLPSRVKSKPASILAEGSGTQPELSILVGTRRWEQPPRPVHDGLIEGAEDGPYFPAGWRPWPSAPSCRPVTTLSDALPHAASPHPGLRRQEFVAFVAAIMAVNALGTDLMLPALPELGRELGVGDPNQRQWVVTAYLFGFGAGQLAYGPLADRFGRRIVLLVTLVGFIAASLFAGHAGTFGAMIGARVLQGLMSASSRVLAVAIVRDSYSGRRMAATMSLAQMVFFLVPILAPAIGQVILAFGPWRLIFRALAGWGAFVFLWAAWRLPETLPPERRRPISWASLAPAYRLTLTNRYSIGYAAAGALTFGGIVAYVALAQQIFGDVFGERRHFGLLFALCAAAMGCASFANSRLVERLGTRLISHSALVALIALSLGHIAVDAVGLESIVTFMAFQALSMTCIGLCGANFGAMAMEPVGHVAGTASSVQGFLSGLGAVAVGGLIGQSFDGTTYPMSVGYLAIGLAALAIVWWVEGGRLFRPHSLPPAGAAK